MDDLDDDRIDELVQRALDEEVEVDAQRNTSYKPLVDTPKAQIIVNRRLITEIRELESSLESYKKRSLYMTSATILLSVILVLLGTLQFLTAIGVVG
ncbi:hypothetical protein HZS55_22015 [Halosimplex rubrum]|uniref:Uncharacterized protein n=1 Tax=Halosimplex rubrum TaxID=869889 RepID=A0A7D5P6M3_9EURY|nr:hypothetical protein [Halosimplex rubrum]QLH79804.1 hypothetical protein HZS55_22015 [Halosimplex rubrum]